MEPNQNTTPVENSAPQADHNIMAVFAYLGILIIIPFLTDGKNNPFVKFHLKQGLILLIAYFIVMFLSSMMYMGYFPLYSILYLGIAILDIIGIINVVTGKQKELPLVGKFAKHFNF